MKPMLTIIIGLLLIALTGLLIERLSLYQEGYNLGYADGLLVLPSVTDIQRRVGAKPDGKVSPDWRHSETQRKWDKAYGQQSANIWINNKSMGIDSEALAWGVQEFEVER